jgi:dihydrofolate reductase
MKLTTTIQISVDGVMQANGGSPPELDGDFARGGWARNHFDDESAGYVNEIYRRAEAFLFGRRTFVFFASYWGPMPLGSGVIADSLNTKPKYVASNTLTDPGWVESTILSGDLGKAIGELKAKPGGELQVHGSGALTRWLLQNDLLDELNLLVMPVVVGAGTRLFPEAGVDVALELVETRPFPKGVIAQVYRTAGRPAYPA